MDKTVIDDCHYERSESIPIFKTSRLHIVERPRVLGCAGDQEVEEKCEHFSIRGYVSEVRKRDWKISWPFSVPDDCDKLDEDDHWLPPLSVSEFRWWRCPNCLQKIETSADTGAGVVLNCFCNKVSDDFTCFCVKAILKTHSDASVFLSEGSLKNFFEGTNGDKENTNLSAAECHPPFYGDVKEKEAFDFYSIKDGKSDYIIRCHEMISHSSSKEARLLDSSLGLESNKRVSNLSLSKNPIFRDSSAFESVSFKWKGNELLKGHKQCSRRGEALNVRYNVEVPTYMSNSAFEFCHKDNIRLGRSNLVKMKEKHDKRAANRQISHEVDKSAKDVLPLNVVIGPLSEPNSMGLYQTKHNISKRNEDLARSDTNGRHIAGQLGTSTLHRKKSQKTRLLTDIVKSEVAGLPNKIYIFNRDAEINSIHTAVSHFIAETDASKDLDLQSGLKSNMVVHKYGKKHVISRDSSRTLQAEDNGPSLMSWLEDTAGKLKINKSYGKGKSVIPAAFHSREKDVSPGITLHPCQSDVGLQSSSRKVLASKRQNKMTGVEDEQLLLTHWERSTSRKLKTSAGDDKCSGINYIQSKSAEGALPGSHGHRGPKQRKAVLSNKKNKIPQTEDGTSSLMHWMKDSLVTPAREMVTDLKGHQKASHKYEQRTGKTRKKDSLDDIPMEIVELMAKNQHERHLLGAANTTGNSYNMQETNTITKVPNMVDFTEVCGKKVPGFLHKKNYSVQKAQPGNGGSGTSTAGKKSRKSDKQWKGDPSLNCGIYSNIHLGISQLEQSSASKGFVQFSQCQERPSNVVQFPVTDSEINSDRWSLTCTQFLEAYHKSQTVPRESSCGQTHFDDLRIPSTSMLLDNNNPHRFDDSSHKCVLSHCADPLAKRNNMNNHGKHDLKPNSQDPAHHLLKQKGKEMSDINNEKEAISAMNLLRLKDEGAFFSTPVDISVVRKQSLSFKKPEFTCNIHRKEFFRMKDEVFRTGNSSMYMKSFEFCDQNQQVGSSLCKISELGSSPIDVVSDSSRSRKGLGFSTGLSNKTSYSKSHRKKKTKSSLSSTQYRSLSFHRFHAQDGNLSNAKKRLLSASDSVRQSKNNEIKRSMNSRCMTEICAVNRNPAEFTIPGAGNAFMIGSEDLDMFPSSNRFCVTTNIDGHKRQRIMKLAAMHGP